MLLIRVLGILGVLGSLVSLTGRVSGKFRQKNKTRGARIPTVIVDDEVRQANWLVLNKALITQYSMYLHMHSYSL